MTGEVFGLVLGLCVDDRELFVDRGLERAERGGVQLDVGVVVDDELFDPVDVHGLAPAVGELGVPPGADEVGVDDAVLVLGMSQQQPRSAVVAVKRSLEVVVVRLGLVPGEVVRAEHGLDLVPHVHGDEGFVRGVVFESVVDDDALVVGVLQRPMQRGDVDRFRRSLRGRCRREPPRGQLVQERVQRPVAGGVRLERELDQRCPVGVEFDGAQLVAGLGQHTDVAVADRCPADRAAGGRLGAQPLGDFGGEIRGVELGDRGHDAVVQRPGRGVVDVLGGGDERDAVSDELGVDQRIVEPVPGEPVDLRHDAVGDVVLGDKGEQFLQRLAVFERLAGLAGFDELRDDDRAECLPFSVHGLALVGQGVALFTAASVGLLLGGDAQIRDRARQVVRPEQSAGHQQVHHQFRPHGRRVPRGFLVRTKGTAGSAGAMPEGMN
ncbi:hypothetical protein N8K70_08095 [Microbacterium betulae]|uniref:Uncharacterized protein n=1 Tax=Microbacterium betulae TaxID=2981139 RepID=A0AA97I8K6_9MICO|nr:hypothetical protein [Microbacterium sp. AB]WOF24600.1 hypothetical protein N8K70_08095 [Microbacterium sp. AB]